MLGRTPGRTLEITEAIILLYNMLYYSNMNTELKEAQTTDKQPMEIMKDLNDENICFNIQVNRLVVHLCVPKMGQPPGQPTKHNQY